MFGFANKRRKQAQVRDDAPEEHARFEWLRSHRRQVSAAVLIFGVVVVLAYATRAMLDRPIQRAEISGKFVHVSRVQIEQVLAPFARQGYVSIDLAKVKHALEQIRWIDHARVARAWPDGIRVFVTEQASVARWGAINSDVRGLLNTRGDLFLPDARDLPAELPELNGPMGSEAEVAKLYLETYPRLLTVGLRLTRVVLDERGAWTLNLSNGVEVRLGRQDVAARLERFIAAASPVLATRTGEVAYVDMRYSNGFSIGWGRAPAADNVRDRDATHTASSHGNA